MPKHVCWIVVTALLACKGGDTWKIKNNKSEMTDEVTYSLFSFATEKITYPKTPFRPEAKMLSPWFLIRLYPREGYQFEFYAIDALDHRAFSPAVVTMRLDDGPALVFQAHEVSGKTSVYTVEAGSDFLRRMRDAKKMLRIEYTTRFDGTRLAHFPLDGFQHHVEMFCEKFKEECALHRSSPALPPRPTPGWRALAPRRVRFAVGHRFVRRGGGVPLRSRGTVS